MKQDVFLEVSVLNEHYRIKFVNAYQVDDNLVMVSQLIGNKNVKGASSVGYFCNDYVQVTVSRVGAAFSVVHYVIKGEEATLNINCLSSYKSINSIDDIKEIIKDSPALTIEKHPARKRAMKQYVLDELGLKDVGFYAKKVAYKKPSESASECHTIM